MALGSNFGFVSPFSTAGGTGVPLAADGTAGSPSFAFISDPDTGMFRTGDNALAFSLGGANTLALATTGATFTAPVIAPVGSAAAPSFTFAGETTTGFYRRAAQQIGVGINGLEVLYVDILAGNARLATRNDMNSLFLYVTNVQSGIFITTGLQVPGGIAIGTGKPNPVQGHVVWQGNNGNNNQTAQLGGATTLTAALSGASVSLAGIIPAGSIVVGVAARVVTAVTGATSFSIGDGTTVDKFGLNIATTAGTTTDIKNWTATTAPVYTAATNIVLTANGGAFTGGTVRVSVFYISCAAPTV